MFIFWHHSNKKKLNDVTNFGGTSKAGALTTHRKTCGNAVFNDPKHLVLSFSHASNELCICCDLWCAMLNRLPLLQCGILHGFFTGSQLGKPKLLNLKK